MEKTWNPYHFFMIFITPPAFAVEAEILNPVYQVGIRLTTLGFPSPKNLGNGHAHHLQNWTPLYITLAQNF